MNTPKTPEKYGANCPRCGHSFAAPAGYAAQIPDVLFDGNAVWQSLDERAKTRTSAENVSDVLDAIVRLMRRMRGITCPSATPRRKTYENTKNDNAAFAAWAG